MDRLLDATYRAEQRHFWFNGFRRFVRPLLTEAIRGMKQPLLLDCGCGTGANLAMLEEFGRAVGFDLTWRGLEYARGMGRRRTAQASVLELPFGGSRFDVVTSFDVLYCLDAPAETRAVDEMFRVLRPGGAAIINVAALDVLRGKHSVLGGEVRRYTRPMLRDSLERAGFRIVKLTYTNATLFPIMLAARTAQRAMGLAASDDGANGDFSVPAAPINAALSMLLAGEAALVRRMNMPVGSSVLCLARKPA